MLSNRITLYHNIYNLFLLEHPEYGTLQSHCVTTLILLHRQQQHDNCLISIRGSLPNNQTSSHTSDQEVRRDPGQ